jgi:hypothetical protein
MILCAAALAERHPNKTFFFIKKNQKIFAD